ncbi:pyridoxamine 5'-phosphate oxidase-like FMN-binding protein [Azorhizobium oxalatiphilum]|uniref:Pyridoxamine 5'-phosphate oxidase-like FMN-binding protein n=1 Tax=Azorhizobium oxalatiphilum TaxID=980631 RepID=A0A917BLT8_9HYPH|nr:pyridoxamine 5'-phosphate oxidase family protein [Azorhizobium oxalatiphilum]GGF49569.1 pyridoxamine 5'-phosphate oxidase-like FMN-binding protein [Azorhizobium oxalatiphilum]
MSRIESVEQLRTHYKAVSVRAAQKVLPRLDKHCRSFIGLSPFVMLATSSKAGELDVTPRGDQPGFVGIDDDGATLLLPDRPGNNRLDSLTNILEQPGVGLIFLIPGVDETLRVNGTAEIRADADLRARFAVDGKLPTSVLRITVREAYLHCAKAFMRSKLWDQQAQVERSVLPTLGEMLRDQIGNSDGFETQEQMVARFKQAMY